jgi:hypothetical protein
MTPTQIDSPTMYSTQPQKGCDLAAVIADMTEIGCSPKQLAAMRSLYAARALEKELKKKEEARQRKRAFDARKKDRKAAVTQGNVTSALHPFETRKTQQNQHLGNAVVPLHAVTNLPIYKEDAVIEQVTKAGSTRARGCRIPATWELTPELSAIALKLGLSNDDAMHEAASFMDHWLSASGQNAVKVDWAAAWRKWCRNHLKWHKPTVSAAKPLTPHQQAIKQKDDIVAKLQRYAASDELDFGGPQESGGALGRPVHPAFPHHIDAAE